MPVDQHLKEKLADEVLMLLHSRSWALLKYSFKIYQDTLNTKLHALIKSEDWHKVSAISHSMEVIDDLLRVSERLPKDITDDNLDADRALSVFENKTKN